MASDPSEIAHLLRRSGFTAPGERVAQLSALDWPAAVEAVLDTAGNPPDDLPPDVGTDDRADIYNRYVRLIHWWLDRCVTTPTPIVEKMVLFWQGHFTSSMSKIWNSAAVVSQQRLYRAQALGNLAPLAQAMAVEPAMLMFLDNRTNDKRSPNQNFARELMEVFLLGVGNFTEADVVAASRAWTGHGTLEWDRAVYVFRPERHDDGDKTFFGITRNWNGPDIINEILTNPAKRPVMARFVARKLWEFFAYQHPEQAVVDAVAEGLLASNLDIRHALRVLFNRPEFRSPAARQGLVRSPIEWVVAVHTHTGLRCADTNPQWSLDEMGQMPFDPPNVSGWRPNGYWVNPSAFAGRAGWAQSVCWKLGDRGWWADLDSMSVDQAIDHGAATFGIAPLSGTTRAAIANWLWTEWNGRDRWIRKYYLTLALLLAPEMHLA